MLGIQDSGRNRKSWFHPLLNHCPGIMERGMLDLQSGVLKNGKGKEGKVIKEIQGSSFWSRRFFFVQKHSRTKESDGEFKRDWR